MTSQKELIDAFVIVLIAAAAVGGGAVACVAFSKIFDVADDEPREDEPLNDDARVCQYAHMHPEIRSKDTILPPPLPFYSLQVRLGRWYGQIDPKNAYLKAQLREVMKELPPVRVQEVRKNAAARRRSDEDTRG